MMGAWLDAVIGGVIDWIDHHGVPLVIAAIAISAVILLW